MSGCSGVLLPASLCGAGLFASGMHACIVSYVRRQHALVAALERVAGQQCGCAAMTGALILGTIRNSCQRDPWTSISAAQAPLTFPAWSP
jgi:hypothetical protein